jgi:hypothetical protein
MFSVRALLATATLTLAAGFGLSMPAHASTPAGCSSVTQIGSTGYLVAKEGTYASVKQFKGCGKNYAYMWLWDSALKNAAELWPCVSIVASAGGPIDQVCGNAQQQELWSSGASTLTQCTYAYGELNLEDGVGVLNGQSSTRC